MNRIIPAGCLAALFLAGCNSPSQHTPVPRNYGAASDVAVTRHTQYTLWDKGVFSGQLPVSTGSHLLTANSDRLSFDWEGDAIELLNELARVRGMQFNYNGVRLPLPVNLHVRDMTFSNTLR
ncbi:IncI1-type conjugal transfer lipoprotein TraH, partial [Salmonella enterica]|nr:IncI1-type conjugal transfer lipoprotein TraH [Salmonella enterica]